MIAIMKCINVIARCATLYRSARLESEKICGSQHTFILNICRNPGISQERLSQLIYINKSNVARQLAVLEQNGYVERKPDPKDRRVLLVYPTDKALEIYPRVLQVLGDWNRYITEDFTSEEEELLNRLMEKMMQKAEEGVKMLHGGTGI